MSKGFTVSELILDWKTSLGLSDDIWKIRLTSLKYFVYVIFFILLLFHLSLVQILHSAIVSLTLSIHRACYSEWQQALSFQQQEIWVTMETSKQKKALFLKGQNEMGYCTIVTEKNPSLEFSYREWYLGSVKHKCLETRV